MPLLRSIKSSKEGHLNIKAMTKKVFDSSSKVPCQNLVHLREHDLIGFGTWSGCGEIALHGKKVVPKLHT